MLALKICLVPIFLYCISLASTRWGAPIAGWLAGLPVVAGPILFFLWWERGPLFASTAATASLSAVSASVCFSLAYAHAAQSQTWPKSLLIGLVSWLVAASALSLLPHSAALALGIAIASLLLAAKLFPAAIGSLSPRRLTNAEVFVRMFAGAILTVAVTAAAGRIGQTWSGLLAVFPIIGIVLAVSSHASQGAMFATTLLRYMVAGLYSFSAFCFFLSLTLPRAGVEASFLIAVASALLVQGSTRQLLVVQARESP